MRIALAGPTRFDALSAALGARFNELPNDNVVTPIEILAIELASRGHDVHIVTLVSNITKPQSLREQNVTVHIVPRRVKARELALSFFSKEITLLRAAFNSIEPDIIHAHWTYENAAAAIKTKFPHLVKMGDSPFLVLASYRDAYRFFRLLMALRTIPRVRNMVVTTPYMIKQARIHGFFGKVYLVANGVPVPDLPETAPAERLRRPVKILSTGDNARLKNVRASVSAFRSIRRALPDAELHLFGDDLDQHFVNGEAGVVGHGKVAHRDLMSFIQDEATLMIHPSLQESFGVILIESMARGIPCIAGRYSGSVPLVLGRGLDDLLVDVTRPSEIARKTIDILTSEERYLSLSAAVRKQTTDAYSSSMMAENYLEVYSEVIAAS